MRAARPIVHVGHLYVLRHGQTTCNRDGIIQGPRIDAELSDEGHRQADSLAAAFEHTRLDRLFVSPMLRARQTAAPLADALGIPIEIVPELYEMDFGDLCGRHIDVAGPVIAEYDDCWSMGFTDRALPGGESPLLVQHRVRPLLPALQGVDAAVVAHGRVNRVLLTSLMGMPLTAMGRYRQENAAITHVRMGERPLVQRNNDISHLT